MLQQEFFKLKIGDKVLCVGSQTNPITGSVLDMRLSKKGVSAIVEWENGERRPYFFEDTKNLVELDY